MNLDVQTSDLKTIMSAVKKQLTRDILGFHLFEAGGTGSHTAQDGWELRVAKDDLELLILLPPPPECWD